MIESLFNYINQDMRFVHSADNEQTLKNAVSALKSALDNVKDSRKEIVGNVLAKYESYLTYSSVSAKSKLAPADQDATSEVGYTSDSNDLLYAGDLDSVVYARNVMQDTVASPQLKADKQGTYANETAEESSEEADNAYSND